MVQKNCKEQGCLFYQAQGFGHILEAMSLQSEDSDSGMFESLPLLRSKWVIRSSIHCV